MTRNLKLEIGYQNRQKPDRQYVAKQVLSIWDRRKIIFADFQIPNEEMCLNILAFVLVRTDFEKPVLASEIVARFNSPKSTTYRYLQLLGDARLLKLHKGNNELIVNLASAGSALLDELFNQISEAQKC